MLGKYDYPGINRRGIAVALPQSVVDQAQALHKTIGAFVLDGEMIGNKLWAFDLLEIGGKDVREQSAFDRYMMAWGLSPMLSTGAGAPIEIAQATWETEAKRKMREAFREAGLEGVAFKKKGEPYVPGRPASGGSQLKEKFWESATLEVEVVNSDRRSVGVRAYDTENGNVVVSLGNVTMKKEELKVGDIVEVKYLYAYPNGGDLAQGEFKAIRHDMTRDDCVVSQLKYKVDMGATQAISFSTPGGPVPVLPSQLTQAQADVSEEPQGEPHVDGVSAKRRGPRP